MSFQSPPFWCLMTTQQEFAKVRETPLGVCMIYVFAFGMQHTHPLGSTLPLTFTNPQAFATYEYNQDKANANMVWGT